MTERILTSTEMQEADRATFSALGLPARAVMEVAGRQVVSYLLEAWSPQLARGVVVLAGGGNNGGDGYVVARALAGLCVPTRVFATKPLAELSGDCLANAQSWQAMGGAIRPCTTIEWEAALAELESRGCGLVVDAVFGTGFRGAVREHYRDLFQAVQRLSVPIVAIDIPSGVDATTGAADGALVADATVCLQALKPGHVLLPGAEHAGTVVVAEIGIDLQRAQSEPRWLLTEWDVRELLVEHLPSTTQAHKGTRGHVAVVGGSPGHYGAPKLSALAAARAGAGLVTLALPESAAVAIAPSLEELMCVGLADEQGSFAPWDADQASTSDHSSELVRALQGKSAIVVGPGIGQTPGSVDTVRGVLLFAHSEQLPTVVDADALNVIAAHEDLRDLLGPWLMLTPHPGEMARLVGLSVREVQSDRFGVAVRFARTTGCWVILKGAYTVIAAPSGELWVSPFATSALATGGSGDVLAGLLGALLGGGFPHSAAACTGVFLHARSVVGSIESEIAQEVAVPGSSRGAAPFGIIAGDIVFSLPDAVRSVLAAGAPKPRMLRVVLESRTAGLG